MLRARLYLIVVCLVAVVAATGWLAANRAAAELAAVAAVEAEAAAATVVVVDRLRGNSNAAQVAALAADGLLVAALGCPATRAELDAQIAASRPPVDPVTGLPSGVAAAPAPTCTAPQHDAVLAALTTWTAARRPLFEQNAQMDLAEREPGYAFPRAPDLIIVADADGVVVGRNGADWTSWYGTEKPSMSRFGLVTRVETGGVQVGHVVWRENPGAQPDLLHAAAAPIRDADGRFLGSLLLGYFVANSEAAELQQTIGESRVGYFVAAGPGNVAVRGESSGAPSDYLSRISAAELSPAAEGSTTEEVVAFGAALTERPAQVYGMPLGEEALRLLPHRFGVVDGEDGATAGFFVITSVSRYVAPVTAIGSALGVAAAVAIIVGLLLIAFALRGFMTPIEDVSRGVQEVIAGNRDYLWPVDEKSYLSDLSHSLNVMSARLQGKVDPDAEEGADNWTGGEAKPTVAGLGGLRGKKAREGEGEST